MSDPLLQIKSLDTFYGDFQALFSVDMNVDLGEVIALIGANGAGKSTLISAICGLLPSQTNQIRFKGDSISGIRPDRIAHLGVAMVPEGRQLFASLSVEENLKLGSTVKRKGHWSLSTIYALFPVLQERRHMPATTLSGGQQQMVAIGRALMANPELILFDEISLGLAPVIIDDIYHALPNIIDQGVAAIIVEQDISRALSVASRAYCLLEGRVRLEGATSTLSRDEITAAYFGVAA